MSQSIAVIAATSVATGGVARRTARIGSIPARWGLVGEWLLMLALAVSMTHCAKGDDGWIGERVVQKFENHPPHFTSRVVARSGGVCRIYRVERVEGRRLWLKAEREAISGWASEDEVVPVERAVDFFNERIRLQNDNVFFRMMRATLRIDRGDIDQALRDYDEVIRLEPEWPAAYNNRGHCWQIKKEFNKAITDYGHAIRLDPMYALAYRNRGLAWKVEGDYDKAINDFDEAIWINPMDAEAHVARGTVWYDKEEYDKAIADFNQAILIRPESYDAFLCRADVLMSKGELDAAFADFERVIRGDPGNSYAYQGRGSIWLDRGVFEKAILDFDEALRLDPGNSTACANLAMLRAACPDPHYRSGKKAVALATKACELTHWTGPDELEALAK